MPRRKRRRKNIPILVVRWSLKILSLLAMAGGILLALSGYGVFSDLPSAQRITNMAHAMPGIGIAISGFLLFAGSLFVLNDDDCIQPGVTVLTAGGIVLAWGILLLCAGYGLFGLTRDRITAMIVAGYIMLVLGIAALITGIFVAAHFDDYDPWDTQGD